MGKIGLVTKEQLKWTDEDDKAVKEYKRKLKNGEIEIMSFDKAMEKLKN